MSEDALQAFPKNLRERDIFNSDEYKALANKAGDLLSHFWNVSLYKGDEGLHELSFKGKHTLRFRPLDPALVLQKIMIDFGGLKPSFFGAPESL